MENKKKFLPQRRNRGLRMAELEKNEEKINENDMYQGIFKEESSDDDFNPSLEGSKDSSLEENEMEEDSEVNDEEEELIERSSSQEQKKNKKEEEIIDIEQLDIDKIDYLEDLREQGIDVENEEEIEKGNYHYSSYTEEDDEDYDSRRKKKTKKKLQKKNKKISIKKKENEDKEEGLKEDYNDLKEENTDDIPNKSEEENIPILEVVIQENEEIPELISKKRKRTNKYESLLRKPKRERINKNVTILGSRNNPRSILINKNIYHEKDNASEVPDKENNKKFNNENTISFALEQELDTKNIIKKFKQQEKDKKQFGYQDKIISQEQRLLESIFTEWENKNSLKAMQKLDEFNRKENTTTNKKTFIDYVKTINSEKHILDKKTNKTLPKKKEINKVDVTFSNLTYYNKIFSFFNTNPKQIKEPKKCAITGNPAKYYDPLTKSYYSTVDSFKLLRERYFQKEEDGLLFRIQTLSDLASQKKERLKKLILTEDNSSLANNASSIQQSSGDIVKSNSKEINTSAIMNIVNKYGILRSEGNEFEKRVISRKFIYFIFLCLDRIYNRNRENCVESGMLLEASKIKLVISKKIFKDKYSSKLPS